MKSSREKYIDPITGLPQHSKKRVLDIYVFLQNNQIKIRFESIYIGLTKESNILPQKLYERYEDNVNNFEMPNYEGIQIMFNTEQKYKEFPHSDIEVDTVIDGFSNSYSRAYMTYTLPILSHHAITALGCLFRSFNLAIRNKTLDCIHLKRQEHSLPFSFSIDNDQTLLSMEDYASMNNIAHCTGITLLDSLILLKQKNHPYYHTLCAIEKITKSYCESRLTATPKPYVEFTYLEKRFELLMPDIVNSISDVTTDQRAKARVLVKLYRELISKNQQGDIPFIWSGLSYYARKNLFALCIGKPAHDGPHIGKVYTWDYSEWTKFLKYAQFRLDENGFLNIVNISNNPGYLRHYSSGTDYYLLQPEMEYLAQNVWGVEFMPGCNFHDKITFTKESTHKLLYLGLHLNVEAMKDEIKAKNNFLTLFKNHEINGVAVPKEIQHIIEDNIESIYTTPKI